MKHIFSLSGVAAALALSTVGAFAASPNLVVNGDFEAPVVDPLACHPSGLCYLSYNVEPVFGWAAQGGGDTFLAPNLAAAEDFASNKYLGICGLGANCSTGLGTAPAGPAFVGLDSDGHYAASIFQSISGLTVGQSYDLTFYFATAEGVDNAGNGGNATVTNDSLLVSFGDQSASTETRTISALGSSPWALEKFTFVATATTQMLTFLGKGGPVGSPPESLIDGVSLTVTPAVPEPSTWALMALGFAGVAASVRRKRRAASASAV